MSDNEVWEYVVAVVLAVAVGGVIGWMAHRVCP